MKCIVRAKPTWFARQQPVPTRPMKLTKVCGIRAKTSSKAVMYKSLQRHRRCRKNVNHQNIARRNSSLMLATNNWAFLSPYSHKREWWLQHCKGPPRRTSCEAGQLRISKPVNQESRHPSRSTGKASYKKIIGTSTFWFVVKYISKTRGMHYWFFQTAANLMHCAQDSQTRHKPGFASKCDQWSLLRPFTG